MSRVSGWAAAGGTSQRAPLFGNPIDYQSNIDFPSKYLAGRADPPMAWK
jgi:hypothetical protein